MSETHVLHRDDAAPNRGQRLLNASFPLFRAFGAEVRAHWSILAVPLLAFGVLRYALEEMGLPVGQAAAWATAWTLAICASAWTHEMAHVFAARRFGVPARVIQLTPLGGLAHAESPMPSPRAEILTALAGPLSHLAWIAALVVPARVFEVQFTRARELGDEVWPAMHEAFLLFQVALLLLNLLPSYPLDVGRALKGFLARRWSADRAAMTTAWVGYGGAVTTALIGAGVVARTYGTGVKFASLWAAGGVVLVWMGVSAFLACRQLQAEAKRAASPFETVEAAKRGRGDDAWKDSIAESERLSRAEDRREKRAAEARRQEEAQRKRLQERIDQLLDRINEVGGVERLTPSERRELAEASELLRKETAEQ